MGGPKEEEEEKREVEVEEPQEEEEEEKREVEVEEPQEEEEEMEAREEEEPKEEEKREASSGLEEMMKRVVGDAKQMHEDIEKRAAPKEVHRRSFADMMNSFVKRNDEFIRKNQ